MAGFVEISAEDISGNPFKMLGSDWMLITAQAQGKVNTMTASWGGFGVMWNKNVAYVVIRPQRYTKEFVDAADTFSLSFFSPDYKKQLNYLGKVSGRDEDKISNAKLTVCYDDQTPYFAEADLALICKKLYAQPYVPEGFIDPTIDKTMYSNSDYHTFYIAHIIKVLKKQD